jgi:hypothetical protein
MMSQVKAVHVYTGDRFSVQTETSPTECLVGLTTWDEGGVKVRIRLEAGGIQVFQVPWSSIKYITWREESGED